MKTTKEKADEIISKHQILDDIYFSKKEAILQSIQSVKDTIEVLQRIKRTDKEAGRLLHITSQIELDEQTELLTELESRL